MNKSNAEMLITVASGLNDILNDVVFVGGAVVYLYFENKAMDYMRPTDDVDCIVNLSSLISYSKLEQELEKLGFKHSMDSKDPICRKIYKGIKVDIMTPFEKTLGFTNKWYKDGIQNKMTVTLTDSIDINIFSLPYFIASKIEAHFSRGDDDFRFSHDIEDIITVLDGQNNFSSLLNSPKKVKDYLKDKLKSFNKNPLFIESISGHLSGGATKNARISKIIDFIYVFTK